jgi:hypothetical protein
MIKSNRNVVRHSGIKERNDKMTKNNERIEKVAVRYVQFALQDGVVEFLFISVFLI